MYANDTDGMYVRRKIKQQQEHLTSQNTSTAAHRARQQPEHQETYGTTTEGAGRPLLRL